MSGGVISRNPTSVFRDTDGKWKTRIQTELIAGVDYDEIDVTYPTSTTEVFTYKLATNTVRTVTVTYLTASKKDIDSVVYV